MNGIDLMQTPYNEICEITASLGYPAFRAKQIYGWAMKGTPVDEMSNLPAELRKKLTDSGCFVFLPEIKKKLVSAIDGTVKYLFALRDGQLIESVVMKYEHGNTICVSSQAGCRMGCRFCASTLRGLERNLTASEILGQVIAARNDTGERISNIVMMGIGEPLDNYGNVIKFLHLVNSPDGLNIGYRHISLSTCGVVPGIKMLAEEDLPITLSISLHNIITEERKQIMQNGALKSFLPPAANILQKPGGEYRLNTRLSPAKTTRKCTRSGWQRDLSRQWGAGRRFTST